jgi:protein AbiQ
MSDLKIYSVSDRYIAYLRQKNPNVYSNKEESRTHTRKYVGVVVKINGFNYYIPMSSPKKSDYQLAGSENVIKKSIIPIIRIVVKNADGRKKLIGTLRISHMLPVPESELELYDIENEQDLQYKDVVQSEQIFIRKNQSKIINNANVLYKQKINNDNSAGYVKTTLPFLELEKYCDEYISLLTKL